jgi:hypothetical protein
MSTEPGQVPITARDRALGMFLGLLVCGLSVRVLIAVSVPHPLTFDETLNVAEAIAQRSSFSDPFGAPTGATAHLAPLYPYVLAGVMKVVPDKGMLGGALVFLALLSASLTWALLPKVAASLGLPPGVGLTAGLMGALYPMRHWVELNGQRETPLAALLLSLVFALTFTWRHAMSRTGRSFQLGAIWGGLALLQPAVTGPFLGLIALSWWRYHRRLSITALALLGFCLVLTPWTVRNYWMLGGLVFVRNDLGLELAVSNHDEARAEIFHNFGWSGAAAGPPRHPSHDVAELRQVQTLGELGYNRLKLQMAAMWIKEHPWRFAQLTAERWTYFWAPRRRSTALRLLEGGLSVCALIGLVALARQNREAFLALTILFVTYTPLYYLVQAEERYRYPIEWAISLCAAAAIVWIMGLAGGARRDSSRVVAGLDESPASSRR